MIALFCLLCQARAYAVGPDEREKARLALESGIQLFKAGKFDLALEQFLLSRSLLPNGANTFNAAMALQELGKLDEAHELFEETLSQFAQEISETNQRSIAKVLSEITTQTGVVTLNSTLVGLSISVDGQSRTLQNHRVRLLPGQHVLRISKAGFRSSRVSVIVQAGKTSLVDVDMRPVGAWLSVKIPPTDTGNAAESWKLLLDGSDAGPLPWDGGVGIGRHLIQIVGGTLPGQWSVGSELTMVEAKEGEITLFEPSVSSVSKVELRTNPEFADLSIDNIPLGSNRWIGYLPHRNHHFRALLSGYLPYSATIDVTENVELMLELKPDLRDPRWQKPKWFKIGAIGGAVAGASLGGRSFASCGSDCESTRPVMGYVSGAILGFQISRNWATTLSAFWGMASEKNKRSVDIPNNRHFELVQTNWLSGPLAMLGVNYTPWTLFDAKLGLAIDTGVWLVRTRQLTRGVLVNESEVVGVSIENGGSAMTTPIAVVQPALLMQWSTKGLDFDVRAGTFIFGSNAPALPQGELTVTKKPGVCAVNSKSLQCSANSSVLQGESSVGPTLLGSLTLTMGYRF